MIFFIFCLYIRFDTFFTFRITKFKTNTLTKVYEKFKNVSKISLNVECHILFIRQIFEKIIFDATFKIQIYFNYELIKIIRQSINQQKFRKKMRKLQIFLKLMKNHFKSLFDTKRKKRVFFVTIS